jgi:phosphate starvation-inducible protein PhoH and related proteins
MHEATISLADPSAVLSLFGPRDQHLRRIRERFNVTITHRDGEIRIGGDEQGVAQATQALEQLKDQVLRRGALEDDDIAGAVGRAAGDELPAVSPIDVINVARTVKPKTPGQVAYVQAIRDNDLVFAIGPAGTGKTYLAVALAVESLKHKRIRKIVLVRPAVEAGESLGYLPGDLQAKINPYLRPLFDALHEMIDHDQIKRLMEQDAIEIVPLAYMRGRTLNEAFIILDEAQNTTVSQMKMFLTRMGAGSKIVVGGDTTQVDLPRTATSGLSDAIMRLRDIERVAVVQMNKADIVRHKLVQAIVRAYDDELPLESSKRRRSSGER